MSKLKIFIFFLISILRDPNLQQFKKNILQFMGLVKQLIYQYYATARLAFQFVNKKIK